MRFLVTMNMPSASGNNVHQVTVEHPAGSCEAFCDELNDNEFIIVRLFYRRQDFDAVSRQMSIVWEDRGDLILNTNHIGKVQEFVEYERDYGESQTYPEHRGSNRGGSRPPIRPGRGVL